MKICNSIVVGCRGWSNCSRSDSQFVQCVLWVLYNRQVLYNRHNEMHTWQYFAASSIFADWGITFYSQKCHVRKMTTNVRKHHTTCIFWTKFLSKMMRKIQHLLRNNTTNSLLCDVFGHYFFQSSHRGDFPVENPYFVSIDTTVQFNRNSIEYYCILYSVGWIWMCTP